MTDALRCKKCDQPVTLYDEEETVRLFPSTDPEGIHRPDVYCTDCLDRGCRNFLAAVRSGNPFPFKGLD